MAGRGEIVVSVTTQETTLHPFVVNNTITYRELKHRVRNSKRTMCLMCDSPQCVSIVLFILWHRLRGWLARNTFASCTLTRTLIQYAWTMKVSVHVVSQHNWYCIQAFSNKQTKIYALYIRVVVLTDSDMLL